MSSFSGTSHTAEATDPTLQLAPSDGDGPSFEMLKTAWEDVISNTQPFVDQCKNNYQTRYAVWPGQSSDGKKHSREGDKQEPTPWDGASDLRVYLTDDAINSKVALYRMAFKRAHLVANPIGSDDMKRARIVSDFMKYLIHTQIPDVDREVELLANYILEKGIGATGQFWETKQEKTITTLTIQQLSQQLPNIMEMLVDPEQQDALGALFEEVYGVTRAKAKKMVKNLATTGKTTAYTLGKLRSYPVLRAFNLDEQLFIPPFTTDLEKASGIYRVEYFTPEGLRSMVNSDGWDEAWVEKAIEQCKGKLVTLTPSEYMQPISRSFVYQQQRFTDQIGVVYAYQRLSDEDGVPGVYQTTFNPSLPPDGTHDGYAKHGLLDYAHGQYPFVIYRREFLSRRLHDSRGLPEPGKPWQEAIKAHKDSRIDAASIAIIPPMMFPMGRPPSRWGPGARIPERRPGEFHFADRPQGDPLTEKSEELLREDFKAYCGFVSSQGDPTYANLKSQNEVDKFLSGLSKSFGQIFSLYQQYGDEQVTFRVLGLRDTAAVTFIKGDPTESYDVFLGFDVQSSDIEMVEKKWAAILQGVQLLNREGNVNFARAIQSYFESIDPLIAEQILEPTEVSRDKAIKEEEDTLTKIAAGVNVNVKPGTPPEIALQTLQNYVQGAPDVQQRLQTDQAFRGRIEAHAKQLQFIQQQFQNAETGRLGANMPGQPMQ